MITKPLPSLLALAALSFATSTASAVIVFPFDGTAGTYRPASYIGWSSYHLGGTVTNLTSTAPNGSTGGPNQIGLGNTNGVGGTPTYLFSISDGADQRFAAVGSVTSPATTLVTWQMGNSTSSTLVRLLVQSAGSWYATQGYTTPDTTLNQFQGTGGSATLVTVDFSTATWFAYDLGTLGVGSTAVALPSTDLTGVGFHVYNALDNSVTRMDNLTLVPEPSAMLLGALGGLALAGRRRR